MNEELEHEKFISEMKQKGYEMTTVLRRIKNYNDNLKLNGMIVLTELRCTSIFIALLFNHFLSEVIEKGWSFAARYVLKRLGFILLDYN